MNLGRALPAISALILSVAVLAAPTVAQGGDPYEPNNDFDQATGPLQARQTYSAAIVAGDRDVFFFEVARRGDVALTLRATLQGGRGVDSGRVGLMVLDRNETPVKFVSADPGVDGRITLTLDPGRFYVDVNASTRDDPTVPYTVRLVSDVLSAAPAPTSLPITDPGRCAYFPRSSR